MTTTHDMPMNVKMTPQEIALTLTCMREVRITDAMNHQRALMLRLTKSLKRANPAFYADLVKEGDIQSIEEIGHGNV